MSTTTKDWSKPTQVSALELAFPANALDLMPPYDEIPSQYQANSAFNGRGGKWVEFQERWFYSGLEDTEITPKEGIDLKAALRHLGAIQGSFQPKHEHKVAAVAYLASLWFEDVRYGMKQNSQPSDAAKGKPNG